MMRFGGYGYSIIGLGFYCLTMLLVLALLVLGVVLIVRIIRRSGQYGPHQFRQPQQFGHPQDGQPQQRTESAQSPVNSALNILNERYAKGEISEEEYKKKKADILG